MRRGAAHGRCRLAPAAIMPAWTRRGCPRRSMGFGRHKLPHVNLTGALRWDDRGRAASLIIRHVGPQFEDDLNRQRLAPATTIDAFFAWPLSKRLQLIARGQNLLDETIVAGIGDEGTIERGTPRTLWIGLRLADF